MKLPKPGPSVYNRINVKDGRGLPFCGAGVIIGKGRNARAHTDLSLDTTRCDGWASIIRDELRCTYQRCGYDSDTSANYVP